MKNQFTAGAIWLTLGLLSTLNPQLSTVFAQGNLTPPGPPAPTMKTQDQLEPRTPIGTNTTPGDADSLFKITQPGSYYLTTNITGVAAKYGIEIAVSGVTLDLMGFELAGVTNALDGVRVSVTGTDLAVRNGTVRSWGGDGVDTFNMSNGQYQDLRLSGNGGRGLSTGPNSAVVNCTARGNGGDGIDASTGSTVSGCAAQYNNGDGIVGGTGSTVSHCSAYGNTINGIRTDFSSTVSGCTVVATTGDGIAVISNCRVVENTCEANGSGGDGAGIHVTGSDNRIDSNSVTDNDRGIDVDAAGNLILRNSAAGNTTNYDIVADNRYGPIINITAAGTAAASGSSAASTLTSTDPWANFSF